MYERDPNTSWPNFHGSKDFFGIIGSQTPVNKQKGKNPLKKERAQLNKNNCIMLLNFINVTEHVRFLYIVCSLK